MLVPITCGPPAPVPPAAPAPPPPPLTPAELVWHSRPHTWQRLLVGLTHLPDRLPLTAKPEGSGKLFEVPSRRLLGRVRAGAPVMLSPDGGGAVRFQTPGSTGAAAVLRLEPARGGFRLEGRRHAGALLCWRADERLACAVDAPLEAYLRGVLPGEVPAAWPLEAQKALAVAARTYAQASRGKHAADGFDVCDGTHCQMYLGRVPGAGRSERAVRETQGLVALSEGALIRAFYSADCGGRTANNEDVPFADNPTAPMPYLRSVPDAPWPGAPHYCARSPHHHWTRLLTAERIEAALNSDPATAVGTLRDLRVAAEDASGRAKLVQVEGVTETTPETPGHGEGDEGPQPLQPPVIIPPSPQTPTAPNPQGPAREIQPVTRTLPGYAFRRAIGTRLLKSTRFTLERVTPTLFRVTGTGYGHGVGLCQIGARGMASAPYRRTFRQILAHYYRGVTVAPYHPTSEPP